MADPRSRINRRKFLHYAAGGSLVSLLAACTFAGPAAPTSAPAPASGGAPTAPPQTAPTAARSSGSRSITVVQAADVPNLDPSRNLVVHVYTVADNVLDTPTYLDSDMKLQPRLATRWKRVDDTTWEVKFRTGVKFHDGTPFDTAAVKASWDYQTASTAGSKTFFNNWASLDAVDASTVHVKTRAADPYFPNTLSRLWIFSPNDLKDPSVFGRKLTGTGPFKLTDFAQGQQITLAANGDYWGGAPKLDGVILRAAPEPSARTAMLQAGQADIVVNLPVEQAQQVQSSDQLRLAAVTGLRGVPLMIDTRTGPPLSDVRVRQAMNYAVDKDSIIKSILGGFAQQQPATISPLVEGHSAAVQPYAYDPDKARQLLSDAGYGSGFEIDFHHPTGRWMKDAEAAQAIAQMLGKVGIKANLQTAEYSTFFGTWSKGDYHGMSMIGVTAPDGAPMSLYTLFLYAKGAWPFSWTDPMMDSLIEKAQSTLDQASRVATLGQLEQFVHDNAPFVFTWEQKDLYGVNKALNWQPPANEIMHLWTATF